MRVLQSLLLAILAAYSVTGHSVKKDGKARLGRYGKIFFGRQVSEDPPATVGLSAPTKQSSSLTALQGLVEAPSLTLSLSPSPSYGYTWSNASSTATLPQASQSSTQSLSFLSSALSGGVFRVPASSLVMLTNGPTPLSPGSLQLPGQLSRSGSMTAVSPISANITSSGNITAGIVSSAQSISSSLIISYTAPQIAGNLSSANTSTSLLDTLSQLPQSTPTGLGPFNTTKNATGGVGINQIATTSPLISQQSLSASPSPLSFEAPLFPTTAILGPLTSMKLILTTNSSQATGPPSAAQFYHSPTMPTNDVATTVFSLLPSGSLLVQLISSNPSSRPQGSVSVVVVTQTAYRIQYVTVTIFHTKSVSGHVTTSAETTTIAVATEAFQTYLLLSPAASISPSATPSPSAILISSQTRLDGESPFTTPASKADSTYATISGFRIVPATSSMTIQFLGDSPVTAVMASQSPASGPNQSFIPLWVPDMLGNAYGGGWIVKPPIWVLSLPEAPVDVKGAVVKTGQGSEVEALSIPSEDGLEPLPSSSFITLIPGMSYSFAVPMPPLLEPISVLVSTVQSEPGPAEISRASGTPSFDTPAKPITMSVVGNGSFISPINPIAPLFSAFGGRATVSPFMCLFSILAGFTLV